MKKNYSELTRNIKSKLNPEGLILEKSFSDELGSISYSDVLTFVRMATKGVEPEYTQRTKEAGEKVKAHLSSITDIEFEYQGSVMTDTHIKGHSDIDLLTITSKFYTFDRAGVNKTLNSTGLRQNLNESQILKLTNELSGGGYGRGLSDLRQLRVDAEEILSDVYNKCDTTHGKAIKITNQSLNRDVDIVIASWYDDVKSIINNRGRNRGVQVYDKIDNKKGNVDYPFTSIERINARSSLTNGRLKRMIRFLKNVKAASDLEIDLSSFDINAICYSISPAEYLEMSYIELVFLLHEELQKISIDDSHANNISSVDDRELIFRDNPVKLANLRLLLNEVESIKVDLSKAQLLAS